MNDRLITGARRTAGVLTAVLMTTAASAALAQTAPVSTARPQSAAADAAAAREARIAALEAQVQALAAQLQELKASSDSQVEQIADLKTGTAVQLKDIRSVQAAQPTVSVANGRPTFSSADGKFTASLRAVMQLDGAYYDQDGAGPITTDLRRSGPALGSSAANADFARARSLKNGDLFRRARLGVDGTAFGDWNYRILLDFGGTGVENAGQVYETWIEYAGLKPLRFKVGAFSPSLGLDDQASTSSMPFLERSAIADLYRGLAGGDTRTTFQITAGGAHWLAAGAVTGRSIGVVNTGATVSFSSAGTSTVPVSAAIGAAQTYDDPLGFTGRLAATPIHGGDYLVHVGVNGSYVERPAQTAGPTAAGITPASAFAIGFNSTPEVRVDGTRLVNTGNIPARHAGTVGVEFAAQKKNLLLQSEYQRISVDRSDGLSSPDFSGYYVSGTWVITGESRKYNPQSGAFDAVAVARPFNIKKGDWGAWELGLRYSEVDLNYHQGAAGSAPAADAIRGGEEKNWSLALNWYPNTVVRVMLDYANVKLDRLSPNAATYQTPVGAQIGQSFNVLSGRAQFAF
jgi:phosphate-selective porin OprO/OprP